MRPAPEQVAHPPEAAEPRRALVAVDLLQQVLSRLGDILVVVLRCTAFQRNDGAAVHFLEVTERETDAALGAVRLFPVNAEVPLRELLKAVLVDRSEEHTS